MGLRKKKTLIEQASEYVDSVKPQIESAVKDAKDKALPLITEAREKAAPVLADARDRATPVIAAGAAVAAEKASQGAALAAEKAAVGRDLAAARLAEVTGKPQKKKKGGNLKKLLLVTGLAALGGFVFKKLKGEQASDNWQSSYVPSPPPPAPGPSGSTPAADDEGGASPDEAVADAAEAPHPVSTPDDPAETVTIDEDAARNS